MDFEVIQNTLKQVFDAVEIDFLGRSHQQEGYLNYSLLTKVITPEIQSRWTTEYEDKIFFAKAHTKIVNDKMDFVGVFGFWIRIN